MYCGRWRRLPTRSPGATFTSSAGCASGAYNTPSCDVGPKAAGAPFLSHNVEPSFSDTARSPCPGRKAAPGPRAAGARTELKSMDQRTTRGALSTAEVPYSRTTITASAFEARLGPIVPVGILVLQRAMPSVGLTQYRVLSPTASFFAGLG